MRLYKLDTILKGELLGHGLSIHYYVRRAYLALNFLRSINFDSAYFVTTVVSTITENKIDIPADFVGLVRIGVKNGQYVESLSPNAALIDNTLEVTEAEEPVYGFSYWYPNVNKYGENMGGYFGYSLVNENSYKILYEENKILINANVSSVTDEVVLQYHTDGLITGVPYDEDAVDNDTAVFIHPYATEALRTYVDWQLSTDDRRLDSALKEKRYYNELRKYRARINPITALMIKRSLRQFYKASPKN